MKFSDWKKYSGPNGNPRRVKALNNRLEKSQGKFKPFPHIYGVDELVLTVLSQNTNDTNRDRAWHKLKEEFPSWNDVIKAPVSKIENAIRVGGLAGQKSKAIKNILKEIKTRFGKFTLDPIVDQPIEDALTELIKFPGVGVKTAACVLVFSYGLPVIPVDTHVHRLSRRLGLTTEKSTADQAFLVLMKITPDELKYPFHVHLIRHGRVVCKSQKPQCSECILRSLCPSAL